jgi:hypothetical protein
VSKTAKVLAVRRSASGRLSDLDMDIAKERERSLEVAQNDARVKDRLRASSSGKVHRSSRNDELQDRDIFHEIRDSLALGASIKLAARQGGGVIKRKTPIHQRDWQRIKAADRKERKAHKTQDTWIKTMWVPNWTHTGDQLKGLAWAIAMHEQGARTLNLNLGPEVIEAARRHRQGFAVYMRRRLTSHLKVAAARLGLPVPEFFFTVEDSDLGHPHLHGAILLPTDKVAYGAFRAALRAAGGDWRGGGSARQLDTRELDTPVRWIAYISKWRLGSALKIQGNAFAATNGVRSMARDWYQTARTTGQVLRPGESYQDTGVIKLTP